MTIVERVVLAYFSDEVFYLVSGCYQEDFFYLEKLLLYTLWKIQITFTWPSHQQELLVERSRSRKSNKFKDCV